MSKNWIENYMLRANIKYADIKNRDFHRGAFEGWKTQIGGRNYIWVASECRSKIIFTTQAGAGASIYLADDCTVLHTSGTCNLSLPYIYLNYAHLECCGNRQIYPRRNGSKK